jgi:hypothetical protein
LHFKDFYYIIMMSNNFVLFSKGMAVLRENKQITSPVLTKLATHGLNISILKDLAKIGEQQFLAHLKSLVPNVPAEILAYVYKGL